MRPPTGNKVSQAQHGPYKAVDYSAKPDPGIYAPEDLTITKYFNNGNAGMQIQAMGASGRHGFAHTESISVAVGSRVAKGQKIGVMGHTGLTVPPGPAGRHVHWTLLTASGYVYPPSKVTEPFGGNNDMSDKVTTVELPDMVRGYLLREPNTDDNVHLGKTWQQAQFDFMHSPQRAEVWQKYQSIPGLEAENAALKAEVEKLKKGFKPVQVYIPVEEEN